MVQFIEILYGPASPGLCHKQWGIHSRGITVSSKWSDIKIHRLERDWRGLESLSFRAHCPEKERQISPLIFRLRQELFFLWCATTEPAAKAAPATRFLNFYSAQHHSVKILAPNQWFKQQTNKRKSQRNNVVETLKLWPIIHIRWKANCKCIQAVKTISHSTA